MVPVAEIIALAMRLAVDLEPAAAKLLTALFDAATRSVSTLAPSIQEQVVTYAAKLARDVPRQNPTMHPDAVRELVQEGIRVLVVNLTGVEPDADQVAALAALARVGAA